MFGLDETIAGLGQGQTFLVIAGIAVLLGLRHATDPDHLTAVTTLVATERDQGARRAGALGLMIMALAVRLILRWRRAEVHSHLHSHDGGTHRHTHVHERAHETHAHP